MDQRNAGLSRIETGIAQSIHAKVDIKRLNALGLFPAWLTATAHSHGLYEIAIKDNQVHMVVMTEILYQVLKMHMLHAFSRHLIGDVDQKSAERLDGFGVSEDRHLIEPDAVVTANGGSVNGELVEFLHL